MDLPLGPVRLRIEAATDDLRKSLDAVSHAWPAPSSPDDVPLRAEVRVRVAARDGPLPVDRPHLRDGDLLAGPWRRGQEPLWVAEGRGLAEVRVVIHGRDVEVAAYGLRQFLRHFAADALLALGGVVLHGAAVARPGGAAVFLAPEGGGKTTLARRHAGTGLLADDTVLVVPGRDGPWVLPSPFRGREGTPATGRAAPLRWLADLHKGGDAGACQALPRPEAVAAVVARAKADGAVPGVRNRLMDVALGLADHPGVLRVQLPWDADPWTLLEGP
jgi:hypothetical protein